MLRSSAMAGIIGEAIVTLRAGRYVIRSAPRPRAE
jgi:hypothetical protein